MACNVCGEETGWAENPLVYCDGNDGHCSVAVHQACYGIISVPSGAWLCGKCVSLERKAKVRCELCPNKDGAFKRTNTGNFAHVVCALYIPEARFGDVCMMEPIILSSIPSESYHRTCYICEDRNRDSKAKHGCCMQCNKTGCKQYFHVTCAQTQGLLCEEKASNNDDNVKYCGYCKHHYQKMRKDHHIKFIPAFKPETRSEKGDSSPEKRDKKSHRHNSDTSKPPKKKQKFYSNSLVDSDVEPERETKSKRKRISSSSKDLSASSSTAHNKHNSTKEPSSLFARDSDLSSSESNIAPVNKKSRDSLKNVFDSDTDEEVPHKKSKSIDSEKKKSKKISSKGKEIEKTSTEKLEKNETKKTKKRKEDSSRAPSKTSEKEEISTKSAPKSLKSDDKKIEEKQSSAKSSSHNDHPVTEKTNGNRTPHLDILEELEVKSPAIVRTDLPKHDFDLPEVIKHTSFHEEEIKKSQDQDPIQTFEELLERQWNQSAQFVMEQRLDISSLISCLYRLKSENRYLDEKLRNLTEKRNHLLSMNSKLAIPLNAITNGLENWESINNQLTSTANNTANSTLNNSNKSNEATTNLFFNQNALAQPNFSSIHTAATNVTSTPSPNTNQSQKANSTSNSNHSTNFFNCVNNLNNNQSFKSSIDLNSNTLNTSFFDSSSLKQNASGFNYQNSLFHNGQLINTSTPSPSKFNASSFGNNTLANSSNNGNMISPALLQNLLHNQQAAFSQINQQSVQNTMNGSQSKN